MSVKLISYTQPVEEIATQGITDLQELIAFCARVSAPNNQFNTDTSEKLVKYLMKHKHWSPTEMVSACVEIETTIDISKQILRHKSFSFQQFSARYSDPTKDMGFTLREARLQDTKNRQNSIEIGEEHSYLQHSWDRMQNSVIEKSKSVYEWAIEHGIAKEQARAVLPEGLTLTKLFMGGTIRSWIHYIELRSGPETQKEHRQIAIDCAREICKVFPMITGFVHENA